MLLRAADREYVVSDDLMNRVRRSNSMSVLTGAGVSAESGIPTFRGAGGIWEKYDFRKLATAEGFKEDPRLVWEWYQLRQVEMKKAQPNPAHIAISEMEKKVRHFSVLTQNIDGMHRRAGNTKIVELHGNIWRMRCTSDNTVFEISDPVAEIPPMCHCGGVLRPDVVWFGEPLSIEILDEASRVAGASEVMFVVGTSALVYPAAALPIITKNSGGLVIEINVEPTDVTSYADLSLFGRAGDILPVFWNAIALSESFMKEHPFIPKR